MCRDSHSSSAFRKLLSWLPNVSHETMTRLYSSRRSQKPQVDLVCTTMFGTELHSLCLGFELVNCRNKSHITVQLNIKQEKHLASDPTSWDGIMSYRINFEVSDSVFWNDGHIQGTVVINFFNGQFYIFVCFGFSFRGPFWSISMGSQY